MIENQKAIYTQHTDLAWNWWLNDSGYTIQQAEAQPQILQFRKPMKILPRPLNTIDNCDTDFMMKNSVVEIDSKYGKSCEFDRTSKVQKYIFQEAKTTKEWKTSAEFITFLNKTFNAKIDKSFKTWSYEKFREAYTPGEEFKNILCLEHEINQRLHEKTEFNSDGTVKRKTIQTCPKEGLDLIWTQFKDQHESNTFARWKAKWSCIELLRLRKSGLTCAKKHVRALMKLRFEQKNIYGMLFDSNSKKFVVLSKIERKTIGIPFCELPQLTPEQYKKVLYVCLHFKEEIETAFGKCRKRTKDDNIDKMLFNKLLSCYNLRHKKCLGLSKPKTLPFAMKVAVPTQRDSRENKLRFMAYVQQDFPELYSETIGKSEMNVNKFASNFKNDYLNGNNISLISCFTGRGMPNLRLYWSLFVPKRFDKIEEVNFAEKLSFEVPRPEQKCLFLDD